VEFLTARLLKKNQLLPLYKFLNDFICKKLSIEKDMINSVFSFIVLEMGEKFKFKYDFNSFKYIIFCFYSYKFFLFGFSSANLKIDCFNM
jgi:hypothetical protein